MVIVETSIFTKQVQKLLSNEEYRQLQTDLVNQPDLGSIIPGSSGLRKVRWGFRGKGKRGGVRTIYYWAVSDEKIVMLLMYPKNVQDTLSQKQLKRLSQLIKDEFK